MADVVSTTRRSVLAIAGVAATFSPVAVAAARAAAHADSAADALARLKTMKAEALAAWTARRPDAEARREAYGRAARVVLDTPSRSVDDLGVKAWIADIGAEGGDIGMVAGWASQVLARDVRQMAGV